MIWLTSIFVLALFAFICARSLRFGTLVFVASLPLYLIRLDIGAIPTTLLELEFFVLFTAWLIHMGPQANPLRILRSVKARTSTEAWFTVRLLGIATAFTVTGAALGFLQVQDTLSAINSVKSYLIEPILLAVVVWTIERDRPMGTVQILNRGVTDYLIALCIPAILMSLFGIFQAITGLWLPDAWLLDVRATGPYPYPNALSHYLAPLVAMCIPILLSKKLRFKLWQSNVLTATAILGTLAILGAQTEAAIGAIFVALALLGSLYQGRKITLPLFLGVIALILIVPATRNLLIEKISFQDWSGQTRVAQWEETANFLTASPANFLLGAGPDNYPLAIEPYHTHDHLEIFQYPHQLFLNSWVEYGFLGLVGLVLELVALAFYALHLRKRGFVLALACGITTMAIHGMVDVPYFKNDLAMMTWVIIALMIVTVRKHRRVIDAPAKL